MGWLKKKEAGARGGLRDGCRALGSLLWKLALAVLLVYGGLQLAVRTDVFRARVERELSRLTGLEIRVGRIRATESLNLRIRDVISVSDEAGLEARLIRVRWRVFRPRGEPMVEAVLVDGLALTFAPDAAGVVQPAFLGRYAGTAFEWAGVKVAAKPGAGAAPAEPVAAAGPAPAVAVRDVPRVVLSGMSVRFQDEKGNFQGSMTGMAATWMSMRLPDGGRISHVDCRAGEVRVVNGPRIRGLHVRLVDTGDRQFLTALEAADWGASPPPRAPGDEMREMLDAMDEDLR